MLEQLEQIASGVTDRTSMLCAEASAPVIWRQGFN